MIESLLTEYLRDIKAENILDVGPGYSNFARLAASVTGARSIAFVDCNTDVLTWQKNQNDKASLRSVLFPMSLGRDELEELHGTYDLILCQEVLEHLLDPGMVLCALVRHLSTDGRIVITVPTKISERWIKRINKNYMKNEPHGHVQEFDKQGLTHLLARSGQRPTVFLPAQPHYFVAHTWVFGSRMEVEGSSGKNLTRGWRLVVARTIFVLAWTLFRLTGLKWWSRLLPRNYFVIAVKKARG